MEINKFFTLCLFGIIAPLTRAQYNTSIIQNQTVLIQNREEEMLLPLEKRKRDNNEPPLTNPNKKTIVSIPKVMIQGNTLHFITPCEGYEFRLVQCNTVCHSEEITGDTLIIPTNLSGTYELQILNKDYIFYTEVVL